MIDLTDIHFEKGDDNAVALAFHQSRYGETIVGAELTFDAKRSGTYAQCSFENCIFTLKDGATPHFLACIMTDCAFDPPVIAKHGGGINPIWDPLLRSCLITTRQVTFSGTSA